MTIKLLQEGVDIKALNNSGQTAWDLAKKEEHGPEVLDLLKVPEGKEGKEEL